jgi:hypothetical protein
MQLETTVSLSTVPRLMDLDIADTLDLQKGQISPGDTLVEAMSGNMGIALAFAVDLEHALPGTRECSA